MNPSLANRLRIGFAITFALLTGLAVIGVGRFFQLRQDFEDAITRSFQLELSGEHLRQSFLVEQTALRDVAAMRPGGRERFRAASRSAAAATADARRLARGDAVAAQRVRRRAAAERRWRREVAQPILAGRAPPVADQNRLARAVISAGDDLVSGEGGRRRELRDSVTADTRNTALLVGAGLIAGLIAAVLLFGGLVASMRRPLEELVDAARRLAGGDRKARVAVGGPAETATLGAAFNEMADELEREASQRDQLDRMKDEFVLTASHELRSPLTSVQGFAELLMLEREKLTPKQAETVEIILDNARHLVRLLNDLLDLARSDAGRLSIKPVPSRLGPLIDDAVRTLRGQTDTRNQVIEQDVDPNLPLINVEPDRIRQILVNLLTNAHEYCQDGALIRVTAAAAGDEVEVIVADNGPGIPPEQLEHIFDRFVRGDAGLTQRVGGTGLGLAITKSLVELHGGTIDVESAPRRGSAFRIRLPALPPEALVHRDRAATESR